MLKFTLVRIRSVAPLWLLSFILILSGLPPAWAVTLSPENLQFLVFGKTSTGRKLSEYLIGRIPREPSDLDLIIRRLSRQDPSTRLLREELEVRVAQMSRELGRLPKGEQNILPTLESLSSRLIRFEVTGQEIHFHPFVSEAPSSSFSRAAQLFIEARSPTRFEEGVPRGSDSMDAMLGARDSIYERLLAVEARYVHELGVLDSEALAQRVALRKSAITLKDITDEILKLRASMTQDLEDLARFYQSKLPALAGQLRKSAAELRLSPEALARYQTKSADLGRTPFEPRRYDDIIRGYSGKIQGELGELRVLVRVNHLSARGLMVGQLGELFPSGASGDRARSALSQILEGHSNFEGKELDLILDQGRTWAEVKTFRDVFTPSHGQYDHVLDQAEMTREIRDLIQSSSEVTAILPEPIQLRIYFVGGVSESAARALENLGFQVFGARISTH